MDSMSNFSYRRLRNDGIIDEETKERVFQRIWKLLRLRKFCLRGRVRVKVRGLRRFRFSRKRPNFFSRAKVSWGKALKRLKNGQVHLNDLFAGNFLVMQANPNPFMCRERSFMGHHGLASTLGKIA